PEATAATSDMTAAYNPVMVLTRPGKSRLTTLGSSTFPTATPKPITAVPTNSATTEGADRSNVPAASTTRAANSARSVPSRPATQGTNTEATPNASSGTAFNAPAAVADRPRLSMIDGTSGPTPTSVGRRFAAT